MSPYPDMVDDFGDLVVLPDRLRDASPASITDAFGTHSPSSVPTLTPTRSVKPTATRSCSSRGWTPRYPTRCLTTWPAASTTRQPGSTAANASPTCSRVTTP